MPLARPSTAPTDARDPDDVRAAISAWFVAHARDLPWRRPDRTAWGVLVSEVMLQQTPVVRVLPAWTDWMDWWPTPADLAAASTADVLRAWGRLGYPRRALRLQECARTITERHGGAVPRTEVELLALPGVGAYTAAAVIAFAYGGRSVVLDTNVRRVLARAIGGVALPPPSQTVAEVRSAAAIVPLDPAEAALWAAASMELGALVCTARAPQCPACPIEARCAWRQAGQPTDVHLARRRTQAWAGTDRQARGRMMALLREALEPVPRAAIDGLWPDRDQLDRCLDSLVADGLAQELTTETAPPRYRLPAGTVAADR
ncbi:A/G-specific adenine glycosylase [Pengzhenrongella phosphoraccumulans]|uniref:A/G-specific adenine glycosylase n=1 Tax=Pengzhenrongella phosphoraccumulans TaxID=3114394 RepID=UPI00388E3B3A